MVHFKSLSYWYWGFLGLIVALFYTVNCLTPYFSDDWHYCMLIGPNGEEDRWIENIYDVFVSSYYHYFQMNGRFVPHFFLMAFDALLGKQFFNVFNALLFGLYLHLLTLNFVQERKNALMGLALSASLTLGFMCGFTNEFLWMSGVFNYEFVAVLVLLFNYLLNIKIHSKAWIPLLFLYGIMCGWTNEAVVIGLCCVYLFVYLRKWRELKWSQVILLSGFLIGVTLCVFSPGSIHRALDHGSSHKMIMDYMISLCYMYNLRIFFIMLITWAIVKKMKWNWLIGVLFAIIFVTFTGHLSGHSRFGIELFSLIILLCIFPYEKMPRSENAIILSVTIIYLLACMPYCVWNYQEFKKVEEQIQETDDGIISTNEVHPASYAERMVLHFNYPEGSEYYSVYDEWHSKMIVRYYKRTDVKLCFVPEGFLQDVHKGLVDDNFDVNTRHPFYACCWHNNEEPSSVTFILEKNRWASLPIIGTMERFSAETIKTNNWQVLEINGAKYLLVKKNPMIQERVIDIKYE